MKRMLVTIIAATVGLFVFTNCDLLLGEDTSDSGYSSSGNIISASGTQTAAYSSGTPIEVKASTAQITVSGLSSGKTVYLTKTNPTDTAISARYTRSISSATGISLNTANSTGTTDEGSGFSPWGWLFGGRNEANGCTTLSLNASLTVPTNISARSVLPDTPSLAVSQITPIVDTTTKSIYVDTDSNISTFRAKTATLRAKGTYCYVWVVGGTSDTTYWTTGTASGQRINPTIAQNIATNFDVIYPMVRNVFGNESDEIIYQGSTIDKMASWSDTGTKVNIVVYDIGNDFNSQSGGSTVGYFYAKDYYYNYKNGVAAYSNAGKYFYIDAHYAAEETSMVYSTLAHEFQHMVDFGVKTMATAEDEPTLQTSSAFNEMKSMLCEDMMYDKLVELAKANNETFTNDDSPIARLPLFNRHYMDIGLEYSNNSPAVFYAYANNYAFGAWLLRNYGGIPLLEQMSKNEYEDFEAILQGVKTVYASSTTAADLFRDYAKACVINSSGTGFKNEVTTSKYGSYNYRLQAIDLWKLQSALPTTHRENSTATQYYKFNGPYLYGYNSQVTLRPYGITLIKVGTTQGSSATISFNTTNIDDAQKAYIIIE